MTSTPEIRRNDAKHCYDLHVDGQPAGHLNWRERGDVMDLVHTEVDPAFAGRGLAGQLVRFVLDEARAAGRKVRPSCSYVAEWLQRHPEYADLVA